VSTSVDASIAQRAVEVARKFSVDRAMKSYADLIDKLLEVDLKPGEVLS
jgi:hypothetical protein